MDEIVKKRRGRGPGKRPALVCTSLRLPREVMEYFSTHYPTTKQAQIRAILIDYVRQQGAKHGTQETVQS